jgi:hypothetical protein
MPTAPEPICPTPIRRQLAKLFVFIEAILIGKPLVRGIPLATSK